MPQIKLTDGETLVVLEEAQDRRPQVEIPLEVMPDVGGRLVVYERVQQLQRVQLSGRLKTRAEAEAIERITTQRRSLSLTDRDGITTYGWRIATSPAPNIRRKDGDSPDWLVDLTLWRLP